MVKLFQQRGRVTYRSLKRQFDLDDDVLEDLKEEILYSQPQVVDDEGKGLSWTGETDSRKRSRRAKRPSGRWLLDGQAKKRTRGNQADRDKKKAAIIPAEVLKEKATNMRASSLSFGELPFMDDFRTEIAVQSEERLSLLTVVRNVACI